MWKQGHKDQGGSVHHTLRLGSGHAGIPVLRRALTGHRQPASPKAAVRGRNTGWVTIANHPDCKPSLILEPAAALRLLDTQVWSSLATEPKRADEAWLRSTGLRHRMDDIWRALSGLICRWATRELFLDQGPAAPHLSL